MLGKSTSVQNAITLGQRKDAESPIIEGLHNHDTGHEINNIDNEQNNNQNNMGPCHACNGPHLVKDCEDSICKGCKPNLDSHTPARCPRKKSFNRQQRSHPHYYTNTITRNQSNGHNDPNLPIICFHQ